MVIALVLLIGVIALGVAAACGWTFDSRDPEYTLRDVFATRRPPDESTS